MEESDKNEYPTLTGDYKAFSPFLSQKLANMMNFHTYNHTLGLGL